jgi:hypothetical protein
MPTEDSPCSSAPIALITGEDLDSTPHRDFEFSVARCADSNRWRAGMPFSIARKLRLGLFVRHESLRLFALRLFETQTDQMTMFVNGPAVTVGLAGLEVNWFFAYRTSCREV